MGRQKFKQVGSFLVVGAGFAGAVHARELAEAGHLVTVVDKRAHIAGNAYDYIDHNSVRVHKYGPHLFHTNMVHVRDWIARFGELMPYEHKAYALLADGRYVDFPVNAHTIAVLFNVDPNDPPSIAAAVASDREERVGVRTAADFLYGAIGPKITDLFFGPYTKKMWGIALEDMDAAVVKRVGIRTDFEERYFPNDAIQFLPKEGYTRLFERILEHANISVLLNTPFSKAMETDYDHVFNSMPIDEYFDFRLGDLPYRSIKIHNDDQLRLAAPNRSVVNYTDAGKFTRETWWHLLPGHDLQSSATVTRTREEPCDYRDNDDERYYPIKTSDDRYGALYERYKALAAEKSNMSFIGRCGTYQYLDMHQVINQSLTHVRQFLAALADCVDQSEAMP
jgi:UDP-galactopyranose mutase